MRYKGIAYPIVKHPQGFFHNAPSDMAQIKSNMAAIILTGLEERLFMPYFGTGLKRINLNAPKEVVINEIRLKIATALKKWEKRVQVDEIIVELITDNDKLIAKINVLFIDPIHINNIENLLLYKSLGGINGRTMPF